MEEKMYKFNWNGNNGRCYPSPGKCKQIECDICGTQMDVVRDVNGPTGMTEALAEGKHLHDKFTCPNLSKSWHKKIVDLVMETVNECTYYWNRGDTEIPEGIIDKLCEKVKKILEKAERQS